MDDNQKLKIKIVTQDSLLFDGEANRIIAPGQKGSSFAILPFHTPFFSKIYEGFIEVHNENDVKKFESKRGIIRVINNEVLVITGI